MGVESGRIALAAAPEGYEPGILAFATTSPAYADKTNATAIHAALGLADSVLAVDTVGAVRSGVGAVIMANAANGLAVLSDVRTGRPGSGDESAGGDAAVTLAFGDEGVIAEIVGGASVTEEFTDRWKAPGEAFAQVWEERFGEYAYLPLAEQAVTAAQKSTGIALADIDHVVITGLHARAVKGAARAIGAKPESVVNDLTDEVGNTGAAHWALLLADVLDRAEPGQTDRPRAARRRLRRVGVADHRPAVGTPPAGVRAGPHRRQQQRPHLPAVPDLARVPRARAAAPAGARPPGRPAVGPHRPLEVRVRRLPRLERLRLPAAVAGEHGVRRDRPDGGGADGRRAGHHRHLHRRPTGVQPEPARRGGDHRLRRRRSVPVRADRRRPGIRRDRRSGDDDVPSPLHERRGAQLLLESASVGSEES